MSLFDEFFQTKKALRERVNTLKNSLELSDKAENEFYEKIVFENINSETVTNIVSLKNGSKSEILREHDFRRLVCIKGVVIIELMATKETIKLIPSNTYLILPDTFYRIICVRDAELLTVIKRKNSDVEYIIKEDSIYNKL
jgi:hypothetical protein